MNSRIAALVGLFLVTAIAGAGDETARGVVFHDANGN